MIHRQVVSIRHKYVDLAVLYRPENKYFLSTSSLYVCYREYHGTISISFFFYCGINNQNDRLANPPTSTLFFQNDSVTTLFFQPYKVPKPTSNDNFFLSKKKQKKNFWLSVSRSQSYQKTCGFFKNQLTLAETQMSSFRLLCKANPKCYKLFLLRLA